MKKIFIRVLIFAIISVLATSGLIKLKNGEVDKENSSNIISGDKIENQGVVTKPLLEEERSLDLYGTYDENDITIEETSEKIDAIGKEIKIPYIQGLKDKRVEDKVNLDIKNKISKRIEEISEDGGREVSYHSRYDYSNTYANFSNVLSFYGDISYKVNDESKSEVITFNYELVTGERLNFEDLFKKDTDVYSIVRRVFYRRVSKDVEVGLGETSNTVYYDAESNEWKYKAWEWTENGEDNEVEKEYVPFLTEYDINKMIKSFMNKEEKTFYFTPTKLILVSNENSWEYYYYLKDIADEVVIYNKYLTEESLYETSDIGRKNIWTCAVDINNEYIDYGFAEDNLYYEVSWKSYYNMSQSSYPFKNSVNKLKAELLESSNDKIEEYRKIAKENPDKFYVLYISLPIDYRDYGEYDYLISARINEYLTSADITYKKAIMDEILDSYRYHNLGFYSSALELAGFTWNRTDGNTEIQYENFTQKIDEKIYDARNLKELTSIGEVFKDGIDYMNIINNNLKSRLRKKGYVLSDADLDKVIEGSKYTLDLDGIVVKIPKEEYNLTIYFSDIDKSLLKIYDLDMYILSDSNTRKLEKTEIQNLDLDELNKAYNEIFARYGHDFKSAELKEYFNGLSWYTPITNKSVSLEELNEIERYNLDIIKSVIADKKL